MVRHMIPHHSLLFRPRLDQHRNRHILDCPYATIHYFMLLPIVLQKNRQAKKYKHSYVSNCAIFLVISTILIQHKNRELVSECSG